MVRNVSDLATIFKQLTLEECMSAIIDYRGKTPRKTPSGIPLITAKIVKKGRIETPDEFIDPNEYESWMRRGRPEIGDVVLTTEAPLGEVGQLSSDRIALAQRLILLRGKPNVLDNTYLKFLMMSAAVQAQLFGRASGTTVIGIKQSELRKLTLHLPPLQEQRAIAAVLGALDERIEQNLRTARASEQLVRATFRAWFVDFEPVRAKTTGATEFPSVPRRVFEALQHSLVESAVGPIPKGWQAGRLGDIASERRHVVQPSDVDSLTPYIGLEHMPRKDIALRDWDHAGKVTSGKARFRAGEILFGKLRPYFHKVGVAPIDGVCSTDIVVIVPKTSAWSALTLGHASSDEFVAHTNACSTGTKMPRTNWGDMARYAIAVPPEWLAASFATTIAPMMATIVNGIFESRKLASIRDLLLPRLLTGRIRVRHG
jgi:type I restriction enzyme, S subunit